MADNLNAPGSGGHYYEFLGVTKRWRMTAEQAHQWLKEGRIVHGSITPGSRSKIPRYKRYADESKGRPALDKLDRYRRAQFSSKRICRLSNPETAYTP